MAEAALATMALAVLVAVLVIALFVCIAAVRGRL